MKDRASADSKRASQVAGTIFGLMLLYAALRYHIYGTTPWSQFPLYTVNKAVAFTAAVLLMLALVNRNKIAGAYGVLGYALCVFHIFASLALLSDMAYPDIFVNGSLNLAGQLTILSGMVATWILLFPVVASFEWVTGYIGGARARRFRKIASLGLLSVAIHLYALGWTGWWQLHDWPARLPPITLLGFVVVSGSLAVRLIRSRRRGGEADMTTLRKTL